MSLDELATEALRAVEDLLARAADRLRPRVSDGGALSAEKLEREQHAAHGLAWLATYVEAIREMAGYARRMQAEGRFGETEALLTQIGARRISRPDFRRHPDEPGRDRPPRRFRPDRGGDRRALALEAIETLIADGNTRRSARAPGRR